MFWDKLERANYFLEAIIDTADRDVDDRTVAHLLRPADRRRRSVEHVRHPGQQARPGAEGGHARDRVSSNTDEHEPRSCARCCARAPATCAAAQRRRCDRSRSLRRQGRDARGDPPHPLHPPRHAAARRSTGSGRDKDKALPPRRRADAAGVRREVTSTLPLDDYVCLVHDPRPTSPLGRTFTVEYLGNVVGAPQVTYLNVEIGADEADRGDAHDRRRRAGLVRLRRRQDDATRPRHLGRAPLRLRRRSTTPTFALDKADAARRTTRPDDPRDAVHRRRRRRRRRPRRWRVENSWGDENGRQGLLRR